MKKSEFKKGDFVRLRIGGPVAEVITLTALGVLVKDNEGVFMIPYGAIELYYKEPVDTFKSSHREGVEL